MTIKGKIAEIFEVQKVSEKFSQQQIAVTTDADGKYPQHISVMANNDKIDLLESIAVGDNVTLEVNLNGRVWVDKDGKNKYFNTLSIYKLTKD